jgi:hypothetical protein
VLLVVLACCELLMVVRARPLVALVGVVAGVALVAAAVPGPRRRSMALAVVGTLPFAVLAWTAIAPLVVTVAAIAVVVGIREGSVRAPARIEAIR